jgi:putative ABC transport system permease protein
MTPISLTPFDVAIAASLLLVDGAISLWLNLGLSRSLAIAATRMVVQLLLIGLILRGVFALNSPALTLAMVAVMTLVAAREVAARPEQRLRARGNYLVAAIAVGSATSLTGLFALTTAIRPQPWFDPHYAIPLVGIVLGSVLNGASLALDTLLGGVLTERAGIEAQLALGATIGQAMAPLRRRAIRRGLLPVVNTMSAAGIITLPGTMTGQILAGMDPVEAVKYQILLMFLLSGAAGLAAMMTVQLAIRRLTDARQRLRLDQLMSARKGETP